MGGLKPRRFGPFSIVGNAIIAYNACKSESTMANLTIRNLDESLKMRLRVRAASRHHDRHGDERNPHASLESGEA